MFEAHNSYHRGGAHKSILFQHRPARRVVSNENNLGEISSGENEFGAGSVQCNPRGQNAEDRHDCNHACYEPHESLLSLIGRLALPPHDLARYNTSVPGRNPAFPLSVGQHLWHCCSLSVKKNNPIRLCPVCTGDRGACYLERVAVEGG